MSIIGKEYICNSCGQHLQFQTEVEEVETTHGYDELVKCPFCNEVIRHKVAGTKGKAIFTMGLVPSVAAKRNSFPGKTGHIQLFAQKVPEPIPHHRISSIRLSYFW